MKSKLNKIGAICLTVLSLYALSPVKAYGGGESEYFTEKEFAESEKKLQKERAEGKHKNWFNGPFLKKNYNIAIYFNDNRDEFDLKKDLEEELRTLPKYPFTIIVHETLENLLKDKKIRKDLFLQDPLRYRNKLKDAYLDGVIIWGYSSNSLIEITKIKLNLGDIKFRFRYYDFTHNKTRKIPDMLNHLPDRTGITKRNIAKTLARYVGDTYIKTFEMLQKK